MCGHYLDLPTFHVRDGAYDLRKTCVASGLTSNHIFSLVSYLKIKTSLLKTFPLRILSSYSLREAFPHSNPSVLTHSSIHSFIHSLTPSLYHTAGDQTISTCILGTYCTIESISSALSSYLTQTEEKGIFLSSAKPLVHRKINVFLGDIINLP